ncbi:hypothetical protein [Marininema halotolerans]|uniref:Uncharacterized protein n=1 Tax=Marininema halotolerans TaxID=1155944 RepID=A0A1I6S3G1_9BACL|nr:hypothetical protein [Marininema halotolerans]SFS71501.1 hypothetical protein SAMN05444972_106122 [Marininema halotolerans]
MVIASAINQGEIQGNVCQRFDEVERDISHIKRNRASHNEQIDARGFKHMDRTIEEEAIDEVTRIISRAKNIIDNNNDIVERKDDINECFKAMRHVIDRLIDEIIGTFNEKRGDFKFKMVFCVI